tara:strand:- start:5306 stop:8155 length:2850 start_codon:yes stop_codon:yes gene_type:complete
VATTPVEFESPAGLTLTLELYPYGSDTIANGAGDACTEATNRHGVYSADVTEALTGLHHAIIVDGSGNLIATYSVDLLDDTSIYRCGDLTAGLNDISTSEVNAEVDTALADYDGPTNAEMVARTLLAADYFDPAADTVANVTTVTTLTGHTAQTGDTFALANGATGFAAIDTVVDAVLVDTGTTIPASIAALNDVAATDIVSNGAITTLSGAVVNVDLVDTTTTNTDMRGTDSAATAANLATVDTNVDAILVDTNDLQTNQGNWVTATGFATSSALSTHDSKLDTVDTVVDSVKAITDQMVFTIANQLDASMRSAAADSITSTVLATDSIGVDEIDTAVINSIAAQVEAYIINEGDATAVLQAVADAVAADWVAGDASPLAIVAALKADAEWSNLATLSSDIATVDANVDAILVDTGTTIPAQITGLNDIAATDIVSAGAITTLAGAVVNVDLVDTTTTNTDMRGTDSAATAADLSTVDANVDAILVDTGTSIPSDLVALQSDVSSILVDTNELQADDIPTTLATLSTSAALATVDSNVDAILVDTSTTIPATIATVDANVDAILLDTAEIGAAGDGLTNINLPNQTMDITGNLSGSVGSVTGSVGSVVGHTAQTGDSYALANGATGFAAIDTVVDAILVDTGTTIPAQITALNDIAATDIVSAGAITTLSGAVVNVDLVDTTTTNTDMRGTDSAATAAALATVDTNVDAILVDTDNLQTNQGNWITATGFSTASALSTHDSKLDTVDTVVDAVKVVTDQMVFTVANQLDVNALTGGISAAGVRSAVGMSAANLDTQLADIPTTAEFDARTLLAADYFDPAADTVANVTTVATNTDLVTAADIGTQVWATAGRALSDPAGFKKSTAVSNFMFLLVDSTDHVTPVTGKAVTAERSLDGASFSACDNSVSEVSDGMYKISFSAPDTNGDIITFKFTASGSDARYVTIATET